MFGTLQCKVPQQEPLTYVENPDLETALSHVQREKPHTSCELCRKRKVGFPLADCYIYDVPLEPLSRLLSNFLGRISYLVQRMLHRLR